MKTKNKNKNVAFLPHPLLPPHTSILPTLHQRDRRSSPPAQPEVRGQGDLHTLHNSHPRLSGPGLLTLTTLAIFSGFSLHFLSLVQAIKAHGRHCPELINPKFFPKVKSVMLTWCHRVIDHDLHGGRGATIEFMVVCSQAIIRFLTMIY